MLNDVQNTLQVASSQQRQAATTNSQDGKKARKRGFPELVDDSDGASRSNGPYGYR